MLVNETLLPRRYLRPLSAALLGIAAALCEPSIAAELTQPVGLVREAIVIPFTRSDGNALNLEAVVTRPAAPGRYPLVLINHGSPRSAAARMNSAAGLTAAAIEFARRGWAVGVVARRGYGRSEGPFAEGFGSCENPHYEAAGLASAQDIIQSAKFLQSQAYVDPDRLLLVGVSAGGFGSLASASLSPRGLAGVINFAGGRGSGSSDSVCREDPLIAAAGLYGKTVRVPTLWVYAENDHFFGPQLARAMFGAFTAAGAPGELIIAPPFGNDGHGLFSSAGIPRWRDLVDDFLRKHHLPTWAQPVTIPIPDLPAPSDASTDAVKEFKRYLASQNYEKAFVFGAEGRFTWVSGRRTAEGAVADALKGCERAGVTCRPYAINDTLMEPVRQSVSVKAAFEKYNLLGMFAWDCAKPASKNNLYYINRALDADHVQRDQMSGTTTRDFVIFIDKAVEVKPNEIAVSGTREGKPQEILWRIERKPGGDGMRVQGVEASWGGKKLIAGGKVPDTGREAPWLNRCGG